MRRIKCLAASWHVMARGARRLELFRDDEDFLNFINLLQYALAVSGCLVWAFTIMTNHYHLVLYGSSDQLTACMRRLNTMYSNYHNRKYGMSGHAFDGPYKAYRQGSLLLLLRCIAYVFLNPVVAGKADRPEDYRWSSYRSFVGMPGAPFADDSPRLMGHIGLTLKDAWGRFHEAMRRELIRSKRKPVRGLTMVEVHSQQFEWLLEHALERTDEFRPENPRLIAMYWGRQCGISPRAMASVLGDLSPVEVSQTLRQFNRRLVQDPALSARFPLP